MTQTVTFQYRDKTGEYTVAAAVKNNNAIILSIEDEYGTDCEIDDWSDAEQYTMKGLAKKAVSDLEYDDSSSPLNDEGQEDWEVHHE